MNDVVKEDAGWFARLLLANDPPDQPLTAAIAYAVTADPEEADPALVPDVREHIPIDAADDGLDDVADVPTADEPPHEDGAPPWEDLTSSEFGHLDVDPLTDDSDLGGYGGIHDDDV